MLRAVSGLTSGQAAAQIARPWRTGAVYGPDVRGASAVTAVAANVLYAHPLTVPAGGFAGVILVVGTAVAAVLGKVAVYSAGAGGNIGSLLAEGTTEVDMNSAGNVELQSNFASAVSFAGGVVWVASRFNGAAQPYTFNAGGLMYGGSAGIFGQTALAPYVRSVGASFVGKGAVASTYADAWPAAPTLSFATGSPSAPIMGLVAA